MNNNKDIKFDASLELPWLVYCVGEVVASFSSYEEASKYSSNVDEEITYALEEGYQEAFEEGYQVGLRDAKCIGKPS